MAQGMEPGLWGQLDPAGRGLPYPSIRGWREGKSALALVLPCVVALGITLSPWWWSGTTSVPLAPRSASGLWFTEPGCALAGAPRFAACGAGVVGIGWGVARIGWGAAARTVGSDLHPAPWRVGEDSKLSERFPPLGLSVQINNPSGRAGREVHASEEVRFQGCFHGALSSSAAVSSSIFCLRSCCNRASFWSQSASFFTGQIHLGCLLCSRHAAWGTPLPGSRTTWVLPTAGPGSPIGAPAPSRNLGGRQYSAPHRRQVGYRCAPRA